jgi:transaldolase
MKLFLDTASPEQIREAWSWGIIDGVTTNPSHVAKTGRPAREIYREILEIVDGPVSLETVTLTAPEIIEEARALAALHPNVVVKVPILKEGLKAVKTLSKAGINIVLITTSEIKTAVIIDEAKLTEGANVVHEAFGLGK